MATTKDFNEPLCGCFNDCSSCLIGFCVPCGICYLQAKAVSDATGDGMGTPCLLRGLCCIGAALNRGKIRSHFEYDGSFLGDCFIHWFCTFCASLQEYREVQKAGHRA